VAQWASYPGDRKSASWFPTQATAEEWKAFVELPRGSVMLDRNAHLRTGNINHTHLPFRPNELAKRSGQGEARMSVD